VLVQIALPLVLILAIATRLITMGQAMSDRQHSAVVLDLWKQQLILRMEQVIGRWESEAFLPVFPSATSIDWQERWPVDERFQVLCSRAQALGNIEALTDTLYRQALTYVPPDGDADTVGAFFPLYDPQIQNAPDESTVLDDDYIMTPERRAFALNYLQERCMKWHEQISRLQWEVVSRVVADLPPEDPLSDGQLTVQMHKLASALESRGFPLLPAVAGAYGTKD
jgi:hypothetical protein